MDIPFRVLTQVVHQCIGALDRRVKVIVEAWVVHDLAVSAFTVGQEVFQLARQLLKFGQGLDGIVAFEKEDCLALSYPDDSFDAVTAAFGIRNFADLDKGLREMCRVLKPGAHLSIVELTTPVSFPMKQLFHVYSHTVLPLYGRIISHDTSAYSYLTKTIEAFPQGERMVEILQKAGFSKASFKRLTFGICTMYFATK